MTKRLCLSKNKKIAGVCGGIAKRYGLEPTIVRLITVLLTLLFKWPVIFIYIVLWVVMPEDEENKF